MNQSVVSPLGHMMLTALLLLSATAPTEAREYEPQEEVPQWTVVAAGGLWCRDPATMQPVMLIPQGGVILANTRRTGNIRQLKAGEMWLMTDRDCIVRARTEYIQPRP